MLSKWSSESDGDANPSQVVDEQTVRFQGQTGEKKLYTFVGFRL